MLPLYSKISRDADDKDRDGLMRAVLAGILATLQTRLAEANVVLSSRGIQQLCLDVHFLMLVSSAWLDDALVATGVALCHAAITDHLRDNASSLPPDDWYDKRAHELREKYPLDFAI